MAGQPGLTFEGVLSPGIVAAIVALLVGAATWSALRARLSIAVRCAIISCRTVAALALAVALLAPARLTRDEIVLRAPAVILLDASESMNVRDAGPTRRGAAITWLTEHQALVSELSTRADVMRFDFGRDLAEVSEWTPAARERLTATGDAISAVARRLKGRPGASIILLSDGRTTAGLDPVRAATMSRERGTRVHAIAVGDAAVAQFRDRKVNNVLCPSVAQLQSAVPIHGFITSLGEKGQPFAVRLKINDEIVETKEVVADDDRFAARVSFSYTPATPGEKRVTVEIDASNAEFDPRNNAMTTFMRVVQKDIRILYLEGRLRWEYTFLKRALAQIPGAHFAARNLFSTSEPVEPQALAAYNVVIIGDVTAAQIGLPFLQALEKKVADEEAGVLFLAGGENLGPAAGWEKTPMAALLPFDLDGTSPPAEKSTLVSLTTYGLSHFAVALDRDGAANVRAWRELPKLEAFAKCGPPKAAATVIATAESGEPLLLSQPFGKGRAMAFLAETAWKWVLDSETSAEKYRRFWHQCILWLARKEKNARKLMVDLERYLYAAGDPVEVAITLEDPPGTPVPDAAVQLTIEGPSGSAPSRPAAFYGGAYHATLVPEEPGDYRLTVEARRGPDDFGRATARFTVISPSAELDQPGADPDALMAVASAGGGLFAPLADGAKVFDRVIKDCRETRVERVHRASLWDKPWLVLLFVAALGTEWFLRKWNRML
jgi:uncharacterized membrane protein